MKKVCNIITISGGKDSQAVAILYLKTLKESKDNAIFIFCDVENESKHVYTHLEYLEITLGIKIHRVKADLSDRMDNYESKYGKTFNRDDSVFKNSIILHGSPPRIVSRWCTKELKIDALYQTIEDMRLLDEYSSLVIWQGVRAEESEARAGLPEIEEYCKGIMLYRPILHWKLEDVLAISKEYGISINPLYSLGAERVGCFPCIFSKNKEIAMVDDESALRILDFEISCADSKVVKGYEGRIYYPFLLRPNIPRNYSSNFWDIREYCRRSEGINNNKIEQEISCSNEYGLCE